MVVLQPNAGIDFAIILDDVIGHSKTLRETHVAHVALERLGPCPLGDKATLFSIAEPTAMRDVCVLLNVCPFPPPLRA
jgi:hypothetical protein